MRKTRRFFTVALLAFVLTLLFATGLTAADTVSYTLYYDSASGKMYTDSNCTVGYHGQPGHWFSRYDDANETMIYA